MGFVVAIALVAWLPGAASADVSRGLRVGIVVPHAGSRVLAAAGAEIPPGTRAYPVQGDAVSSFAVRERLPEPSEGSPGPLVFVAGEPAPVYATDLPSDAEADTPPIVVVLDDTPPPGLEVTSCTSGEGIHVSLWSGSGTRRARRWSAYLYLGYDTEVTCSESEVAFERTRPGERLQLTPTARSNRFVVGFCGGCGASAWAVSAVGSR